MNCMEEQHKGRFCKFPEHISFESVPDYFNSFIMQTECERIVFDLSKTKFFHLSFVGFLLHAKNSVENNNGDFELVLSNESVEILKMIGLYDHFCGKEYKPRIVISA